MNVGLQVSPLPDEYLARLGADPFGLVVLPSRS